MEAGIVVIGAGQAACQFAASIRQYGYQGTLTLIGSETHFPYQRPPLSKSCLHEDSPLSQLLLRPPSFYESIHCRMLLGREAQSLNLHEKIIFLDNNETLPYTQLVLATGADACNWPDLPKQTSHIFTLRTWDDAQALGRRLSHTRRLGVLGAGYVGLEVAASARQRGIDVSVFEAAPRVLQRSVGVETSSLIESLHHDRGVKLNLGVQVEAIKIKEDSTTSAITLNTNTGQYEADTLVVGIGASPNINLAQQAGLSCGHAIQIDANCRTNNENVYAIGDCTEQILKTGAPPLRLESVQNAIDQAKCAAAILAGKPRPQPTVPWFWSDQYGHRIQVAGMPKPNDEIVIRRSSSIPFKQSVWYVRDGRITAIESVNALEDFMAGRQLIKTERQFDTHRLADSQITLSDLIAETI